MTNLRKLKTGFEFHKNYFKYFGTLITDSDDDAEINVIVDCGCFLWFATRFLTLSGLSKTTRSMSVCLLSRRSPGLMTAGPC